MTTDEIMDKMRSFVYREHLLYEKLLPVARAAVNAMKDAGMTNSADPLAAVLFEAEAMTQERHDFLAKSPHEILEALFKASGLDH